MPFIIELLSNFGISRSNMKLRTLLICGLICGCGAFTSCTDPNSDDLIATQVADGTMPPWLVESDGGYTDVTDTSIAYNPPSKPSSSYTKPSSSKSSKASSKKTTTKKKAPAPRYYTVKKGDALERIARRNGVSTSALKKANGLKSDLIRPGQKLRIP